MSKTNQPKITDPKKKLLLMNKNEAEETMQARLETLARQKSSSSSSSSSLNTSSSSSLQQQHERIKEDYEDDEDDDDDNTKDDALSHDLSEILKSSKDNTKDEVNLKEQQELIQQYLVRTEMYKELKTLSDAEKKKVKEELEPKVAEIIRGTERKVVHVKSLPDVNPCTISWVPQKTRSYTAKATYKRAFNKMIDKTFDEFWELLNIEKKAAVPRELKRHLVHTFDKVPVFTDDGRRLNLPRVRSTDDLNAILQDIYQHVYFQPLNYDGRPITEEEKNKMKGGTRKRKNNHDNEDNNKSHNTSTNTSTTNTSTTNTSSKKSNKPVFQPRVYKRQKRDEGDGGGGAGASGAASMIM